jgi:hypothetical protein
VVDRKANTIDAAVHANLLPPRTGTWRAFAVVGIRNPSGGSWLDGSETIFDLAFVGDEPFVRWQDNRQSDILAGQLSSTHAAATLDFAKMSSGATELVDETAPGFKTFLFHSTLDLPEGINLPNPARLAQHEYLGPYQPYQVFIPEAIPEGNPLTVNLHGANSNHMVSIFDSTSGVYLGTSRVFSEDPFLIGMFVPDFGINQVLPATTEINVFGRGETLGYQGISEIDVLEARADAMQRLGTDPDRVTLRGSSMGGVGAYRLGTFYPDLWAATMPHIGTGISYRHIFGNLRNVPVRQVNGFFDNGELGPPSENDAITLDDLDYDHHYWLMLDRGHDGPSYILCVWAQAADFVRNPNPAQVVYKVDPAFFQFDPSRDVDIVYDSAYWVSGIELADELTLGSVDAMSQALPHSMETIVTNTVVRDNMTSGQDLCGPNPNFAPGWTPAFPAGESWLERSLVRVPGAPLPLLNSLSLDVENVAAVAIDLVRAGFAPGEAGTVEVASGGPVDVTLTGLSRKAAISVDGLPIGAAGKEGTVTVALPAGPHEIGIAAQ